MKVETVFPTHLSEESQEWFQEVSRNFELDSHHLKLLTACCEALDRATEAREAVARDGAYFTTKDGATRKHPGIAVELQALTCFSRLLRELGLDISHPSAQPPVIRGGRR
jgi:P27 family predicted phage terminase small subunit